MLALAFAAALAHRGVEQVGYGDHYIVIDRPAPGYVACVYHQWNRLDWGIYLMGFRLREGLCKVVEPGVRFGRVDVREGTNCPPDPARLEPVAVNVRKASVAESGEPG
ncbi:MAG: hypothetical protein OXC69_04335 [Candidatus Tectomicrobia bacterium]|nr:hypothetical protein [Candidatus Tectomicrobia bacterium]